MFTKCAVQNLLQVCDERMFAQKVLNIYYIYIGYNFALGEQNVQSWNPEIRH